MKKRAKARISKETVIYDALRGMCLRLGVNQQLPTVRELCKSLETSCSTLDRVLRQLKEEQIIVARQGGGIYVSPLMARRTIGLVFPELIDSIQHSPFWSLVLWATKEVAAARGHELRVYFECPEPGQEPNAAQGQPHIARDLEAGRIDGLLAVCRHAQSQWLAQWQPPQVVYNRDGEAFPTVQIDLQEMVRLAVGALADAGCRRVALASSQVAPAPGRHPHEALAPLFSAELARRGLEVSKERIWHFPAAKDDVNLRMPELSIEAFGYYLARVKMGTRTGRRQLPFDGLLIADDMVARGMLTWITQAGWRPEQDLHIAAFANAGAALLRAYEDRIHQVWIDPMTIVSRMMDLLEDAMAGKASRKKAVVLSPKLTPPRDAQELEQEAQRIGLLVR